MNKGRAKCERLKKIRKAVADGLHVDLHQTECTFEGNCRGTCPKCRQEEEILNRELLKRAAGLGVGTLAGLSLVGCAPLGSGAPMELTGEAPYEEMEWEGQCLLRRKLTKNICIILRARHPVRSRKRKNKGKRYGDV